MTFLFVYKIAFVIEMLIAETIFSFRLERRKHFVIRLLVAIISSLLLGIFYPLPNEFGYSAWYTSIMFVVLATSTVFYLCFCFKTNFTFVFFTLLTCYTFQQISYLLFQLLVTPLSELLGPMNMYGSDAFDFSDFNWKSFIVVLLYIDCFVMTFGALYFIFNKKLKTIETVKLKFNNLFFLIILLLVVDVVLNAIITYSEVPLTPLLIIYIYNLISCFLLVYIENSIIKTIDMGHENEVMKEALIQATKQYETQKDTIEMINIKCHDLKHQIALISSKNNIDDDYVKEIKDLINVYDSSYNTGNEVLNIILTEKALSCQTKDVRLSAIADVKGLETIKEGDLYSLIGNILDNAIEASTKIEDKNKRCIDFSIKRKSSYMFIKCQNYFVGNILFENNLPKTIKDDKANHGFGMKSIKNIADKYSMNLEINIEKDVFSLLLSFKVED